MKKVLLATTRHIFYLLFAQTCSGMTKLPPKALSSAMAKTQNNLCLLAAATTQVSQSQTEKPNTHTLSLNARRKVNLHVFTGSKKEPEKTQEKNQTEVAALIKEIKKLRTDSAAIEKLNTEIANALNQNTEEIKQEKIKCATYDFEKKYCKKEKYDLMHKVHKKTEKKQHPRRYKSQTKKTTATINNISNILQERCRDALLANALDLSAATADLLT